MIMSKNVPSKLANLRELVAALSLTVQIQAEIADILDDYEKRLYSLDEDRKRLVAVTRAQDQQIKSLEKRYSELLYKFSEAVQAYK